MFTWGFNQTFIGSFLVTLTNKENFDWEKGSAEYSQNVSLLSSLFFLGNAFGNATLGLFLNFDQRKFLAVLQVLSILISGLVCIENDVTFIVGRILIGYINGLQMPTGQSLLFQLSPPTLRQKALTFYSMCLPIGILVVMI